MSTFFEKPEFRKKIKRAKPKEEIMKKLLSLVLITALTLALFAGCANQAAAPAETTAETEKNEVSDQATEKTFVVGHHEPVMAPYCAALGQGAADAFAEAGIEQKLVYGDLTTEGQLKDLEDFIAQEVDAIMYFPWVTSAQRTALEECRDANIPVFVVDSPVEDTDLVISQVATDNYAAGVQCAEHMIENLGGKGKIVILDTPENNSSLLRANGFCDTIAAYPEIEVLSQQNYNANQQNAMQITEDLIQVYDVIDAFFACNEDGAFGVSAALVSAGRDSKIYTVDGSANGCEAVRQGLITGIAAQQPYQMGYICAQQVIAYLNGEETIANYPLDTFWVDATTVDQWEGF